METCEHHDGCVVVFESSGNRRAVCPLCVAEEKNSTQEDKINQLEEEVDNLKADNEEISKELDALKEEKE